MNTVTPGAGSRLVVGQCVCVLCCSECFTICVFWSARGTNLRVCRASLDRNLNTHLCRWCRAANGRVNYHTHTQDSQTRTRIHTHARAVVCVYFVSRPKN